MNFFKTVSFFYQNQFINPTVAVLRHTSWQFRKIFNFFPCDLSVGDLRVRIADRSIANGCGALLNAMGYYDPNNMYFLEEIFRRHLYNTLFDIGANIGIYSLLAASQADTARVFAFEPHDHTFSLLQENIRLNSLSERVTCFKIALSDHKGHALFLDKPGSAVNHILDSLEANMQAIEVEVSRGDLVAREESTFPEIVKIDVEGHENQVISGLSEVMEKVQLIFVECQKVEETTHMLQDQFHFWGPFKMDYRNRRLVGKDLHYEDWIFINPNSIKTLTQIITID